MGVVDFEDVAAGRSLYVDSETHSLLRYDHMVIILGKDRVLMHLKMYLNDADVVGFDHHFTELGCDEQSSCLWDFRFQVSLISSHRHIHQQQQQQQQQ